VAILYLARFLLPIGAAAIEHGALLVENGRIADVGPAGSLRQAHPGAELCDFGQAILLPPLVNAHTHLELTAFPEWAVKLGETAAVTSFVDWIKRVIRVKRGTHLDRFLPSLRAGIQQSLASGTGAVGDILSFFPARVGYAGSPLRGTLFLETLGRDPGQGRKILQGIGGVLDEKSAGQMQLGLSPHSPYTLSLEYLEAVLDYGRRRRVRRSIHLGESPAEAVFLADSDGEIATMLYPHVGWEAMLPPPARRSPVAYLGEAGGLQPETLLVHGVQVDAEDAAAIAAAGATMVLCPRSNARLEVGTAPVELYLRHGVNLALGTDSLASCDSLSIWDEIAFARRQFSPWLCPNHLLRMATLNGAQALGLGGQMGSLAPGWGAHFQLLRPATLPTLAELEDFLTSPGRNAEVAALYLAGRDVLQKP
jgi:cytosine/adenosine deaminase-related metal-dependent hydrolase